MDTTNPDKAVVYMVAGMSSRFGGKIKQFAEVGERDETLIEVSINQALDGGFNKIIFIVGTKTEKPFKEKFGDSYKGFPVLYAYQKYDEVKRDKPWGTTDALCAINEIIDCPFVVCNGDDLYGASTFKVLNEALDSGECATAGYKLGNVLPNKGSTNRGIFTAENGYVVGIKEVFGIEKNNLEKDGLKEDDLCSMNIFALQKEVVGFLKEGLDVFRKENEESRNVESILPQDISDLIVTGKIKMRLLPTEDSWAGVTNPGDEIAVREFLKK